MIVPPFRWGSFTSQKELNAKRCALAAKWIQIANARQPLALTLPLNSLGGRHAPLAARVLAYTSSLKRKTGQCRVVARSGANQCPLKCRQLGRKRTHYTHSEFFAF